MLNYQRVSSTIHFARVMKMMHPFFEGGWPLESSNFMPKSSKASCGFIGNSKVLGKRLPSGNLT